MRSFPESNIGQRPRIGITMGDPAGIGAEIIVKALAHDQIYKICRPLVVGDAARLRKAIEIVGLPTEVNSISDPDDGAYRLGQIDGLDLGLVQPDLPFGIMSAAGGEAAFRYVEKAASLALSGAIDAICTAPLSKEAMHAAGHRFPGHTELLASLTGIHEVSMMLVAPGLRVVHVTTHLGLIDAIDRIEPGIVGRTIDRGHDALVSAGFEHPRIGVCGINPHAGENGLFGRGEEEHKILPAVQNCQRRGLDVTGPWPADTLFFRAGRGDFDLVVAMYHDQGHGPIKVLGLEEGVNVTLGLPIIRTSVDHGTAFDIAGSGKADERSLLAAIRYAVELAPKR